MGGGKKRAKSGGWSMLVSVILILVAIIAFLLLLLNGETIVTGEFDGNKIVETLICESDKVVYTFFPFDESDSKYLKINAVFEDEKLDTISLMYKLNYGDEESLSFSEARNRAEMNKKFNNDEMKPDSLSAKYGIMSDGMQFSIYAKGDEISGKTLKYFMLNNIYDINRLDKEKMAKYYNNAGLDCVVKYKPKEEDNENEK